MSVIFTVVLLICSLIIISGVFLIFKGKKEFSPSHEKSVTFAGKLIILGLIIFFVGHYIGLWILSFFSVYDSFIYGSLQTILSIPFYLVSVYLIKELADDIIKNLLWIGFYAMIVIGIYSSYIGIARGTRLSPELVGLSILISIIPGLIFLFCYYKTLKLLQEKHPISSRI